MAIMSYYVTKNKTKNYSVYSSINTIVEFIEIHFYSSAMDMTS